MNHDRRLLCNVFKTLIKKSLDFLEPYTRLIPVADTANWVIANEMQELSCIVKKIGGKIADRKFLSVFNNQSIFFGSHFDLLLATKWFDTNNRLATAYFHGKPGVGINEFDTCYKNLIYYNPLIHRIQVSYSEMRDIILESGISSEKVFHIPIGINLSFFSQQTALSKRTMMRKLGIPETAVVIGSFQKDGEGWGDGMNPKLIKGPDVFLKTVEILKRSVPELFILLSGPARGYIKSGLERLKIPYKHVYQKSYSDIGRMFQALDLYIVASREEGGPKAVLESMASGVPLVTTRVGQAMDSRAWSKRLDGSS